MIHLESSKQRETLGGRKESRRSKKKYLIRDAEGRKEIQGDKGRSPDHMEI